MGRTVRTPVCALRDVIYRGVHMRSGFADARRSTLDARCWTRVRDAAREAACACVRWRWEARLLLISEKATVRLAPGADGRRRRARRALRHGAAGLRRIRREAGNGGTDKPARDCHVQLPGAPGGRRASGHRRAQTRRGSQANRATRARGTFSAGGDGLRMACVAPGSGRGEVVGLGSGGGAIGEGGRLRVN